MAPLKLCLTASSAVVLKWRNKTPRPKLLFSHLLPKPRTDFYVYLIDGVFRIFPNFFSTTWFRTHVSSVTALLRDLNPGRFTDWATTASAPPNYLVGTEQSTAMVTNWPHSQGSMTNLNLTYYLAKCQRRVWSQSNLSQGALSLNSSNPLTADGGRI